MTENCPALFAESLQDGAGAPLQFPVKIDARRADAAFFAGAPVPQAVSPARGLAVFGTVGNAGQAGGRDPEIAGNAEQAAVFFRDIVDDDVEAVGKTVEFPRNPAAQLLIILPADDDGQVCAGQQLQGALLLAAVAEQALDLLALPEKG